MLHPARLRNPALLLRALSALLSYPDGELREALPEIVEAIRESRAINRKSKEGLIALADEIARSDKFEAQGRYVELFDLGRRTSLNLFEHIHGDSRKRGPAMIELQKRYGKAGLEQEANLLPDHLPVLLEYLSCCKPGEMRDTLGEISHVVRRLGNTLLQRNSRYAAVMAALLDIGRKKGLDARAPPPPPDDIDGEWEEKPAFAEPDSKLMIMPEKRRA
ncbi:MAG: nitrate reductase molybdenum cofactor assembly chaperone [Gammaproteobacteria bacterium]|nr:nitrate reductase molybdenum cofactor assembly chaperone [Gammaproteobacteria bacterium]